MELNAKGSLAEVLTQAQAEKEMIEAYLRGGQSFVGQVIDIGDHSVVIGPLAGKDFYDAQIRIDDISAIALQTRGK